MAKERKILLLNCSANTVDVWLEHQTEVSASQLYVTPSASEPGHYTKCNQTGVSASQLHVTPSVSGPHYTKRKGPL
jgi:hypothetical protein